MLGGKPGDFSANVQKRSQGLVSIVEYIQMLE